MRDYRTGRVGITTDEQMKTRSVIAVMWIGANYPVRCQVADLEVVSIVSDVALRP